MYIGDCFYPCNELLNSVVLLFVLVKLRVEPFGKGFLFLLMFHKFPICSQKSRYLCFFSVSDLMRLDSMTLLCKHFDEVDPIKTPPVPTG